MVSSTRKKKGTSQSPIETVTNIFNGISNLWNNHRWELFLIISLIVLTVCCIINWYQRKDEYRGLSSFDDLIIKKTPRATIKKKHEKECRRIIETIYNVPFNSIRPDFLKNPKTGKNLELDMYNPSLKLALEYQGAQHRKYIPFFHAQYSDYLDQLERDKYKAQRCKEEGIDLICIPDTIKFEDLKDYIIKQLKQLGR